MSIYSRVLHEFARRHGLSRSQHELLKQASSGLMGPQLAAALQINLSELASLETLFARRTGISLGAALREIDALIRRSSRPPESTTIAHVRERSLQRAHERTDEHAESR